MKVLQVFNRYLERGGEEMAVEHFAEVLGARHQVFECRYDSAEWQQQTSPMARIIQALRLFHHAAAIDRFQKVVQECQPDVILLHNVFPVAGLGVLRAAANSGIPIVHVMHNFRPFSVNGYLWSGDRLATQGLKLNFLPEILSAAWQGSRIKTALLAIVLWTAHALGVYRKMDAWLAISEFMRDTFVRAGVADQKIHVLRHSWDKTAPKLADGPAIVEPTLVFIGRLTEAKGVATLLHAWRLVESRMPEAKLVICGTGPFASTVEEAARVSTTIQYRGHVEGGRKAELLASCTAMVVPSIWWEPLGLVVYEAYQYGKPVLAARSGGLTETVMPDGTGWVHEPGNAQELAEQILEALSQPQECQRRGDEGRKWLAAHTRSQDWLEKFDQMVASACRCRRDRR